MTRRQALLLLSWLCLPAARAGEGRHGRRPRLRRRGGRAAALSLDEAVSLVRGRVRGRVLAAERKRGEYRVRVLTPDGRVRRFRLDPDTGEFR